MLDFLLLDYTTFAIFLLVMVFLAITKRKSGKSTRSDNEIQAEKDRTYVPLLKYENGFNIMVHKGVSTVNFFSSQDADFEVSKHKLKARLKKICEANPWLVGTLVHDKKRHERVMCSFPNTITDEDIDAIFLSEASDVLENISSSSPYSEMAEAMDKVDARVWKTGYKLVNQPDRMCKVSLLPINGGKELAFIFSVSHVVADGCTYYKLLSMFREDNMIEALQVQRMDNFSDVMARTIGAEEEEMLFSPYFFANCVRRRFYTHSRPNVISASFIDPVRIAKAKQDAKYEHSEYPNFYVSTNDIVTSAFGKAVGCNLLLMLLNMRGRAKEVSKSFAGNYEALLMYDRESYNEPSKIRQCLNRGPPFRRMSGKPTMSRWQRLTTDLAMITSWIFPSFDADIHLWQADGFPSSMVSLHLPLYAGFPSYPLAIVFKPCKGRVGIFCFHRNEKDGYHQRLLEGGNILGESVSPRMFLSN